MASGSNARVSPPTTFIRAPNPARDKLFRAMAPSTTQIRTTRGSMAMSCSECFKDDKTDGIELRKCSKAKYSAENGHLLFTSLQCKSVWYCSKECQKKNWSLHKDICRDVENSLSKLIKSFIANPLLCGYLQICLALDFNLVEKPAPDTPFMARVDVGLQPSDINVFHRMCSGWYGEGREAEPGQIEGVFQINAISPASPDISPYPHRLLSWNKTREKLRAEGQASTPVIILEFVTNDYKGAFTLMLPISPTSLKIAREKEPFESISSTSNRPSVPMTPTTCLNFINSWIRTDSSNQLLLRMNMREEDKNVIRAVSRGEEIPAGKILKEKLEREKALYIMYDISEI